MTTNESINCLSLSSMPGHPNNLSRCGEHLKEMIVKNQMLSYLSLNETKLGNESFDLLTDGLLNNTTLAQLKIFNNGLDVGKSIISILQLPIFELDLSHNNLSNVFPMI